MKIIQFFILVVIFFGESNMATATDSNNLLYPQEKLITINGFQSLIQFAKGNPNKPLIVFVPGNAHLARIGYGYPKGDPKDFLAYWLHKKGYSFLGVSYPMDNNVYSQIYPAFNIDDWGNLIISAAKKVINQEHLSNNIIIIGWSMAGSIVQTANSAAKRSGLNIELFIGLSAVPPIPYIMHDSSLAMNKMLPNHLADRTALYPWFCKWMEEQSNYNDHTIIPKEIYLSQFIGNIPIAIGAEGYHYEDNKFIFNVNKTLKESGVFDFSKLPWIAQIHDDSPITMKLSLIDPYGWYFIFTQMLYQNYLKNFDLNTLNAHNANQLAIFINSIPKELTMTVHGNHLFFVGQKGAEETAEKIDSLINSVNLIKAKLNQKI